MIFGGMFIQILYFSSTFASPGQFMHILYRSDLVFFGKSRIQSGQCCDVYGSSTMSTSVLPFFFRLTKNFLNFGHLFRFFSPIGESAGILPSPNRTIDVSFLVIYLLILSIQRFELMYLCKANWLYFRRVYVARLSHSILSLWIMYDFHCAPRGDGIIG
jgi:hypothetical protein